MTRGRTRVACVIGTRPEAIKMAPVVRALQRSDWARCLVLVTAQHRDLLDRMLAGLEITVDHDLDLMTDGQTPSELIARMLPRLEEIFLRERAGIVLAQGDTATVFVAALAAFHNRIPFGHVEAGLRTYDLARPFPEEGYRQMVSRLAHWHFAPTRRAAEALRGERIPGACVHVTGNTGIDTLLQTADALPPGPFRRNRLILVTAHRRESFGVPLRNLFRALRQIAEAHEGVEIVYPVHPNPNVSGPAGELLAGVPRIRLLAPLDYVEFVDLMRQAWLVLTDSGGIQEEAPALGKPVLVLRERTERPEAVEEGVARLVGTDSDTIVEQVSLLMQDPAAYAAMAKAVSPYGDGHAAERIVALLAGRGARP